jgi:tetratricopeptide (TPR) repeat protein
VRLEGEDAKGQGVEIAGLVDELEADARQLLFGGRPSRFGRVLLDVAATDLRARPWAALVVAAGIHEIDRANPAVGRLLDEATVAFDEAGDDVGLGYTEFVRGNVALGHGRLVESAEWWGSSRRRLEATAQDAVPLGQTSLGLYQQGDIAGAKEASELAVLTARMARSIKAEVTSLVHLAFFHLNQGACGPALEVIVEAERILADTTDPADRGDVPLVHAARGCAEALRGHREEAESAFAAGIAAAEAEGNDWYEAISRCLRGELTGHWRPDRAIGDGRHALAALTYLQDSWWQTVALRAMGVGAVNAGDVATAVELFRRSLAAQPPPLEAARTQVRLADALLLRRRSGDVAEAVRLLTHAEAELEAMGGEHWLAWAYFLHAEADTRTADRYRTKANRLRTSDDSYTALLMTFGHLEIHGFGMSEVRLNGKPVLFKTHNAEAAVILLADAGPDGMSAATLAAHLWPEATEAQGEIRTKDLVHSIRSAFGRQAWRLDHHRKHLRLDMMNAAFDIADAVAAARSVERGGSPAPWLSVDDLLEELGRPVLPRWAHAEWVDPIAHRVAARAAALQGLAP